MDAKIAVTRAPRRTLRLVLAILVLLGVAVDLGAFERVAHAIIGRPLTPMSYAGVARRTTRRAVIASPYRYYGVW